VDEEIKNLVREVAREAIDEYLRQLSEIDPEREEYFHALDRRLRAHKARAFYDGVDRFNSLISRFEQGLDLWATQGCG
jgi:hypothetical protein